MATTLDDSHILPMTYEHTRLVREELKSTTLRCRPMEGSWVLMEEFGRSLLVRLNWKGECWWPADEQGQLDLASAEGYSSIEGFCRRLRQLYRGAAVKFLAGERCLHLHTIEIRTDYTQPQMPKRNKFPRRRAS